MKEYKIARGWKIFIYLTAPFMIGLFVWTLTIPFADDHFSPVAGLILIPISLAMITLFVVGVVDTHLRRVLIADNEITTISILSRRTLRLHEIRGYTVNDQYIFVEPLSQERKRIRISKYTGGYAEILLWIDARFTDLDEQTAIEEANEIIANNSFGETPEARARKHLFARRIAHTINILSGLVFAWVLFSPKPYEYALITAILTPFIAIGTAKLSNGLIRVDEKKGSVYPSVLYAIIFPALGIMVRGVFDFNIYEYREIWTYVISLSVLMMAFTLFQQKELTFQNKADYVTVLSLGVFFFIYSFGTTIYVNCYYDNAIPQVHTSKVLSKQVSSGNTTTYYLELSPWGEQTEPEQADVSKNLYNEVQVNDDVNVYFYPGRLGISWFDVSKN